LRFRNEPVLDPLVVRYAWGGNLQWRSLMTTKARSLQAMLLLGVLLASAFGSPAGAAEKPAVPDLIAGGTKDTVKGGAKSWRGAEQKRSAHA
jgi:hypothetical protein